MLDNADRLPSIGRPETMQDPRPTFGQIYAQYRRAIGAYCYQAVGNSETAEDLVQETFARAWSHLDQFDSTRPLWPWLSRIAQRVCIDHWRREAKRNDIHIYESFLVAQDECPTEKIDREARVHKALSALNPRYRRMLLLHVLEGWSYKDLALAERSTVTSIGKVLNRARNRARQVLELDDASVLTLECNRISGDATT
jgi:RNA polymerase sigma-70 factor, ECF subfamily